MSGGSWDYFYANLSDIADRLVNEKHPLRRAFGRHLHDCAAALKDIEFCDSGDVGPEPEIESIKKALGTQHVPIVIEQARIQAEATIAQMQRALENWPRPNEPKIEHDENTSTAACNVCNLKSTWGGIIHARRQIECPACGRMTWHTIRANPVTP